MTIKNVLCAFRLRVTFMGFYLTIFPVYNNLALLLVVPEY